MGYGTSFGFRLPGHFFSQADEVKPALFVPLWGFLGEVSQRCKYVGSVGRPAGARGCGPGARGRTPGHPPSQVGPLDSFNTVGDMWMLLYVFLTTGWLGLGLELGLGLGLGLGLALDPNPGPGPGPDPNPNPNPNPHPSRACQPSRRHDGRHLLARARELSDRGARRTLPQVSTCGHASHGLPSADCVAATTRAACYSPPRTTTAHHSPRSPFTANRQLLTAHRSPLAAAGYSSTSG